MSRAVNLEDVNTTSVVTPVVAGDIDGVNYQSGCEGLTKTVKEYFVGASAGDPAKLTTMKYTHATYPYMATSIAESDTTV